ncbi:hypothetical protein VM98_19085 [Streptomyces rubellomurinus subsp. indigoferus]|nr:hypothetical protein VM98_19085 [Streptomyces rubellomurinus subsp. indigoferus]
MNHVHAPTGAFRGAGGPLLLACLGWACAVPTLVADDDVRALVSTCHDSPGAAVYVLPLAWAGVALGVGAVCWGGWQLATGLRHQAKRRSGLGRALLCLVLPVAALAVPVQYALVRTAAHDTGTRHSTCFGLGRLTGTADPVGTTAGDARASLTV